MLLIILFLLFIFWLFGYGIAILPIALFNFAGHVITLWDILIFIIVVWLIGLLPSPFGEIASVLIILWVLSVLGIIGILGAANLLVIAIIIGLLIYILRF